MFAINYMNPSVLVGAMLQKKYGAVRGRRKRLTGGGGQRRRGCPPVHVELRSPSELLHSLPWHHLSSSLLCRLLHSPGPETQLCTCSCHDFLKTERDNSDYDELYMGYAMNICVFVYAELR